MPSLFLRSASDSDPLTPELSYHDSMDIKEEQGDFMDYMMPFVSPEKSLDRLRIGPNLDSDAISISDVGANVAVSPLLTPDTSDCTSSPDNSPFGSDSRTEVDHAFINQISCFSDLSDVLVDASDDVPANSSNNSHCSASTSQSPVEPAISLPQDNHPQPDKTSHHQSQIFAHGFPWVLSCQPTDTEDWVEWSGPVTLSGREINISGWEPPENDIYPLANVDLKDWMPWAPMLLSINQRPENESAKSEMSVPKTSSSPKTRKSEAPKSWARRFTSNRQVSDARKKRRIESILPPFGREEAQFSENSESNSVMEVDATNNHGENVPTYATRGGNNPTFNVPSYIYPQPAVARAVTQRAAGSERERALAANSRLQDQLKCTSEAEATQRLLDEFLLIPEVQDLCDEGAINKMLVRAFNPSRLPSPVPGASVGARQALRPTRSLDYSVSTRRRALVRFRSDTFPRAATPLAREDTEKGQSNDDPVGTRSRFAMAFQRVFDIRSDDLDTFPSTKQLLEEDNVALLKRVRAS